MANDDKKIIIDEDWKSQAQKEKEPLKEELQHFVDCMERREKPRTDGVEGLAVLRVLERAEKKLKTNG